MLPPREKPSAWLSERMAAFVSGVGPIVAGLIAAWQAYQAKANLPTLATDPKVAIAQVTQLIEKTQSAWRWTFLAALLGAVWAGVALVHKLVVAHDKDKKAAKETSAEHLMGPLHVLYQVLKKHAGIQGPSDPRFRATIHRVDGDSHEQYVPYVGYTSGEDAKKPGPNRRWSNHAGGVGIAILTKEMAVVRAPNHVMPDGKLSLDAYHRWLIEDMRYTSAQAKTVEGGRVSAIAIPIFDGDEPAASKVIAVLYCDSSELDFFKTEVQQLTVAAGGGLASFIKLMYSVR